MFAKKMVAVLTLSLLGNSVAFAQAQKQYKQENVNAIFKSEAGLRRIKSQLNGIFSGQHGLEDQYQLPGQNQPIVTNKQLVSAYFEVYLVAEMTQVAMLPQLTKKRMAMMTQILRIRQPAVHQHVVDTIFNKMKTIASTAEYHPAVRYNALLTVGLLNQSEAGNFKPPIPHSQATSFLVQQYQAAKTDAVRLGALVGFLRHVELDRAQAFMPVPAKQQIVAIAEALMNADATPKGSDPSGHIWMRRRAIDILATVGFDKPDGSILKKITSIIADKKAPLSLRLTAARSLSKFRLDPSSKINSLATANALAALAVDACRAEADRVTKRKAYELILAQRTAAAASFDADEGGSAETGGGGGAEEMAKMFSAGAADDGTGGAPTMEFLSPADRRMVYHSTLRIRSQLYSVFLGLGSKTNKSGVLQTVTADGDKAAIEKLSNSVVNIVRAMDGKLDVGDKNEPPKLKKEMDLDTVLEKVSVKVVALSNQLPNAAINPKQGPATQPQPKSQPTTTKKSGPGQTKKKSDLDLLKGGTP